MSGTSWGFLLLGALPPVGAAMALGTLTALLRYHRTGGFPGREGPDGDEGPEPVSRRRLVVLWIRVALGVLVAGVGVASLQGADLL